MARDGLTVPDGVARDGLTIPDGAARRALPFHNGLPYRGAFGAARPRELEALPLPPGSMPSHWRGRPLKAWRYIGVYGPELMLCLAQVRIGRTRQAFWALWDRSDRSLLERTALGRGGVRLAPGTVSIDEPDIGVELRFDERPGIESVCPTGASYAWTRKQGGVRFTGTVDVAGRTRALDAFGVIDDTAAYYARHTRWRWSAGVGHTAERRAVAWNLVAGVNDPPTNSERTVWLDGEAAEVAPCRFADDLSGVDDLRFHAEAERARQDNFLVLRSSYRQPFGTFSGLLPGGIELAEGYGVMEEHDAWW